ncbi:lactose-binding lectin l-2-like [Haliotis cracherodii]|uniref:lactose-binding lectin l-2-like n=1 Tax=Haliotis cracherodii TaxID=6455 RepID=UPI0039E94CCC
MFTFSLLLTGYIAANIGPFLFGVTLRTECAVACVDHPNCSSFFYDIDTQGCYLEKYVYVSSDQLQDRTGVHYYILTSGACPDAYIYCRFTNQCLRLCNSTLPFPDARTLCVDDSGHLAFIMSEKKNKQASIVANNNPVWIGLKRDDSSGGWHWTNGQPLGPYSNWNPNLRNSSGRNYVRLFPSRRWGSSAIGLKLRSLCELDIEKKD